MSVRFAVVRRLCAAFLASIVCSAVHADVRLIDFEDLLDGDVPVSFLDGVGNENGMVVTAGLSLNEFEFPPNSGQNALLDAQGPVTFSFSAGIAAIALRVTYNERVMLELLDASLVTLGVVTSTFENNTLMSGQSGSAPNELLEFNSGQQIFFARLLGSAAGGSFVVDDLQITTTVPEPSTATLAAAGLALLALAMHAQRRSARRQPVWRTVGVIITVGLLGFTKAVSAQAILNISPPMLSVTSGAVSQSIAIVVTTKITNAAKLIPASVSLLRYNDKGKLLSNHGRMYDDGTRGDAVAGDGMFTAQVSLAENAPQIQQFRVTAAMLNSPARVLSDLSPFIFQGNKTPEQTLGELAGALTAGDIDAALTRFSGSPKNRNAIVAMGAQNMLILAQALRGARLIREVGNLREYEIVIYDAGTPQFVHVTMARTSTGSWQIVSW